MFYVSKLIFYNYLSSYQFLRYNFKMCSCIDLGFFNPTLRQNSTKVTSRSMQLKNREDRQRWLRGGNFFTSLPSTMIDPSLSHSPLPVLPVFELHGSWRHFGALLPERRIKKNPTLYYKYHVKNHHKFLDAPGESTLPPTSRGWVHHPLNDGTKLLVSHILVKCNSILASYYQFFKLILHLDNLLSIILHPNYKS